MKKIRFKFKNFHSLKLEKPSNVSISVFHVFVKINIGSFSKTRAWRNRNKRAGKYWRVGSNGMASLPNINALDRNL